jgi:hypothetical protein
MATNNAINNPKIMFFAYLNASTGAVTGDGTGIQIPYDRVLYDTTSSMNLATGAYLVPKSGKYFMTVTTLLSGIVAHTSSFISMSVPGVFNISGNGINPGVVQQAGLLSLTNSAVISLTAGQSFVVSGDVNGGAKVVSIQSGGAAQPNTWFCGFLID